VGKRRAVEGLDEVPGIDCRAAAADSAFALLLTRLLFVFKRLPLESNANNIEASDGRGVASTYRGLAFFRRIYTYF
jgi:hypothetical protein